MGHLLYYLPALACPVGMGLMMWMMMRPKKNQPADPPRPSTQEQELARLRNEIAALRDERTAPAYPPVDVRKTRR
jgi:hypothetical protein